MKRLYFEKKRKISIFAIISFLVFLTVYIMLLFAKSDAAVADALNGSICHCFRSAMAKLGGIFPFSIYEAVMLSIPLIAALLILLAVRSFKKGCGTRFVINIFAIILLIFSGHNLSLGIGYHTTPIDEKMALPTVEVTEDRLAEVLISLRDEINLLTQEIEYKDGVSFSEDSFEQMNDKLLLSYDALYEEYSFPKTFSSTAKKVHFGNLMSYMGITGIYTFFSGDANVNSAYPEYDMTFTTAHELSHQRGISRENEANFIAYLVTSGSDDPFIRYSGALNMYVYIGNALYRTSKDRYYEINKGLSELAKGDLAASAAVSEKYGDTVINDISTFINDLFLKSNGTAGVVTYGRVVTLTVSYFESQKAHP